MNEENRTCMYDTITNLILRSDLSIFVHIYVRTFVCFSFNTGYILL
jgi:hypothetical protein